jgi:hypothetical protein
MFACCCLTRTNPASWSGHIRTHSANIVTLFWSWCKPCHARAVAETPHRPFESLAHVQTQTKEQKALDGVHPSTRTTASLPSRCTCVPNMCMHAVSDARTSELAFDGSVKSGGLQRGPALDFTASAASAHNHTTRSCTTQFLALRRRWSTALLYAHAGLLSSH